MRSYKEILRFLIVREQLSLGWKLGLFVVCAALYIASGMLFHIKAHSVDLVGTVTSHGAAPTEEGHESYLLVLLDNGTTVRARPLGSLDYRPGSARQTILHTRQVPAVAHWPVAGRLDAKPSRDLAATRI